MRPGLRVARWWQDYVRGRLRSPRDLCLAAELEFPDPAQSSDRFLTEPCDGFRWEAPQRLRAPSFILSEPALRQWNRADWQQVDRRLMVWAATLVELARKRGIPLYVHAAFRTEAEQADAVARGSSRASYPRSPHNIGEAIDIVHGVYHWTLTKQEWSLLHVLGLRALDLVNAKLPRPEQLQLTWGGLFKTLYDPAHWEISDYRGRIKRLPVGPPQRYTPRGILRRIRL